MMIRRNRINFFRIIWVSCLFLFLVVILVMVMDYKINYEYSSSDKLYFYQCDSSVCTMDVKDNNKTLYSVYECNFSKCPVYKRIINDDYALLEEDNGYVLYNYKTGNKISDGYDDYIFINNDYIIVREDELFGIIDINNTVVVNLEYDLIGYYKNDYLVGYNTNNIIAKKGDDYGIINYKNGSQLLFDMIEKS